MVGTSQLWKSRYEMERENKIGTAERITSVGPWCGSRNARADAASMYKAGVCEAHLKSSALTARSSRHRHPTSTLYSPYARNWWRCQSGTLEIWGSELGPGLLCHSKVGSCPCRACILCSHWLQPTNFRFGKNISYSGKWAYRVTTSCLTS